MIIEEQKIILSIDYEPWEINQPYIFGIENASLKDYFFEFFYKRIIFGFVFFFVVFYFLNWDFIPAFFASIIFSLLFLVFLPLGLFYLILKTSNYLSKGLKDDKDEIITVPMTFTFDEVGVERSLDSKDLKHSWREIHKVVENHNEFFIFYTKLSSYLIPKRVFADSDELDIFKNFLKLKLGNKAEFKEAV